MTEETTIYICIQCEAQTDIPMGWKWKNGKLYCMLCGKKK